MDNININEVTREEPNSGEKENRERRLELDLLKSVAIISMIICHAVFMLGVHHPNYEQDIEYFVADIILGCYVAVAHAFMFSMGFGIAFSRNKKPSYFIKRGIFLYILAFILNFFRYGVYALVDGIIEGQFVDETLYALVVQDIFHFAGIAFIITGAFKALKLKEWHIFVIGIILSMVGAPLAFLYNGHPVLNYIIGHFIITTKEDSTFAFFNWYIFVSFGLLFGSLLKKTSNKDKLYLIVLIVSLPLMVIYIILSILFGPMFLSKNCWYYATSLPESIGLLSIDMVLLSSFYFLIKKVPIQRLKVFEVMSRNITPIYITQWCIIGFVDSIFCYLLGFIFPYWAEYLFGVVLIFISYWIAKGSRILQRKIFNKQIKSEIK